MDQELEALKKRYRTALTELGRPPKEIDAHLAASDKTGVLLLKVFVEQAEWRVVRHRKHQGKAV